MNKGKSFHPSAKCGNCLSFRHSEKDRAGTVIEKAHCAKGLDPRTCGDEFKSRNKRIKKSKKKIKRWKHEAKRNENI